MKPISYLCELTRNTIRVHQILKFSKTHVFDEGLKLGRFSVVISRVLSSRDLNIDHQGTGGIGGRGCRYLVVITLGTGGTEKVSHGTAQAGLVGLLDVRVVADKVCYDDNVKLNVGRGVLFCRER